MQNDRIYMQFLSWATNLLLGSLQLKYKEKLDLKKYFTKFLFIGEKYTNVSKET
jgi:hypothetical protein